MDKKKPTKSEDTTINFRISKELKAKINTKAVENNQKASAYLRNLLVDVHNGNYCYEEKMKSERASFLYSKEFLQLIFWMSKKRVNKRLEIKKDELIPYINTLKKIGSYLPNNLVEEFDKVLKDVLLIKANNSFTSINEFEFPVSSQSYKKFNFELLENFLLNDEALKAYIDTGNASI